MRKIFFAFPGNESMTRSLAETCNAEMGLAVIRHFPDGESYIRITSDIKDKQVIVVCTLFAPDDKIMALYFFSQTAKEMGAAHLSLVAPYLAYMRQDTRFHPGESITSISFSKFLSTLFDSLITVDPHLHRIQALSDIYTLRSTVIHSSGLISDWIKTNVVSPVLVGPDEESMPWVSSIAQQSGAPFIVLQKIRKGDRDVEIAVPGMDVYKHHTPVLVDDIISTAGTMITIMGHLHRTGMHLPVCIGVHGIFAGRAYEDLRQAGAKQIVTCNTIPHVTNRIYVDDLLAQAIMADVP